MIVILGKYQLLQNIMGLNPYGGFQNILLRIVHLVILVSGIVLLSIFLVLNFHDDMNLALSTLPPIFGFGVVVPVYLHLILNCERINSLLSELQDIVNKRIQIDVENAKIHAKANQENTSAMITVMKGISSVPITYFSPFILVAVHWCMGKYTIKSWLFFFPLWTPFELNTAFRCSTIVLFEALLAACVVCVLCTVTCLLIGIMIFARACLLDIQSIFVNIDHLSKLKNSDSSMLEYAKDAVVLHEHVNIFTSQLKDVANAIVLVILLPWTICICISLFIIAKYSGTDYIYDLQMPFLGMSAPLCLSFIYFYIGEEFHSLLMDMSDAIYQTEWHRYPPSVQRYLLLMIMRARRPFYLSAYGIVTMNLPNFVGLLKWIYSAFMLLLRSEK